MDSGAIHLIGNLPLDAEKQKWRKLCHTSLIRSALNNNGASLCRITKKVRQRWRCFFTYLYNKSYPPCIATARSLPASHSRPLIPARSALRCLWRRQKGIRGREKHTDIIFSIQIQWSHSYLTCIFFFDRTTVFHSSRWQRHLLELYLFSNYEYFAILFPYGSFLPVYKSFAL